MITHLPFNLWMVRIFFFNADFHLNFANHFLAWNLIQKRIEGNKGIPPKPPRNHLLAFRQLIFGAFFEGLYICIMIMNNTSKNSV